MCTFHGLPRVGAILWTRTPATATATPTTTADHRHKHKAQAQAAPPPPLPPLNENGHCNVPLSTAALAARRGELIPSTRLRGAGRIDPSRLGQVLALYPNTWPWFISFAGNHPHETCFVRFLGLNDAHSGHTKHTIKELLASSVGRRSFLSTTVTFLVRALPKRIGMDNS